MLRPVVCLLILAFVACEQPQNMSRSCYICTSSPPHAQVCHAQLGRIQQKEDTYACNLYFGESHLCESAEHCCQQAGLLTNEEGVCESPDTVAKDGE